MNNTSQDKAKIAESNGWTDVHGGDTGAYWRGINPITKKMEAIPKDQMVEKLVTEACSRFWRDDYPILRFETFQGRVNYVHAREIVSVHYGNSSELVITTKSGVEIYSDFLVHDPEGDGDSAVGIVADAMRRFSSENVLSIAAQTAEQPITTNTNMKSELPQDSTSAEKQPSESDTDDCSIPYHTLGLESDEKVMTNMTTKMFPDGRKISVGVPVKDSEETGIFVKIYKPLDDGKESLLSFRISEEAGAVLCSMLYDVLL